MDSSKLAAILRFEEGYKENAYYDSQDYPTIGIGKKIGPRGALLNNYKFTVPLVVAELWVVQDCGQIVMELSDLDWYCGLSSDRKMVIVVMAYQLGVSGVKRFNGMINAIEDNSFVRAASEMQDSLWHNQTPERCERLALVMQKGDLCSVPEYKQAIEGK